MINVEGDAFGAGIIAHLSRKELSAADASPLQAHQVVPEPEPEISSTELEDQRPDHVVRNGSMNKENGRVNPGFIRYIDAGHNLENSIDQWSVL